MGLRKYIDKIKPHFEKGGKFYFLHSTFEAFETFLFVPNTVTKKGSHIRDSLDLKRVMITVVIALLPPLLFGMWNIGYQHNLSIGLEAGLWANFWFGFLKMLPIIIVSYLVGLGTEFAFAQIRHHEVNEGFLVSGLLIPMIVPVDIPLWMVAVATFLAVVFGKEVFGGTGMNILNPALLARAILFFSYPAKMSGAQVWIAGMSKHPEKLIDNFSGATMLGQLSTASSPADLNTIQQHFPLWHQIIGNIPGSIGETSVIAIALGAIILLITGVASWKIMLSAFAGGAAMGIIFNLVGGDNIYFHLPWYEHLFIGGFAFGMVYMATDPVTSAQTETGKWIYGLSVGILAILIRVVNPAYPEGVMLAILLMNVTAPLIDYLVVQSNIKKRLKRAKIQSNQ